MESNLPAPSLYSDSNQSHIGGGPIVLDLNQVAAQVGDMIGRLRADFGQQRNVWPVPKTLRENEANSEALKQIESQQDHLALVAGITDGLDRRYSSHLSPTSP